MLILPIVNRDRVLNVRVSLKNCKKIRSEYRFSDIDESEIIVNNKKLSESIFNKDSDDSYAIDFVRNNSILYARNFMLTTREYSDSNLYDVYELDQPPKKINSSLDLLYNSALIDKIKSIPGHEKGRYLSLEKIGFQRDITDRDINILERIITDVKDRESWPILFEKAGVGDLPKIVEFFNNFDCTVVKNTTILEYNLQSIIDSLNVLNTRESRNLANYYNMALSNRDVYAKISYINKLLYGRPLELIKSENQKEKQLIKSSKEE